MLYCKRLKIDWFEFYQLKSSRILITDSSLIVALTNQCVHVAQAKLSLVDNYSFHIFYMIFYVNRF